MNLAKRSQDKTSLYIRLEHAGPLSSEPEDGVRAALGRIIVDEMVGGLFTNESGGRVALGRKPSRSLSVLKRRGFDRLQVVTCGWGANAYPEVLFCDADQIGSVRKPWDFASGCGQRLAGIIERTKYWHPARDPARDVLFTGQRPMTYTDLVGHIAAHVEQVQLPTTDEQLAATLTRLGTAIAWAVAGGWGVPPLGFGVHEERLNRSAPTPPRPDVVPLYLK